MFSIFKVQALYGLGRSEDSSCRDLVLRVGTGAIALTLGVRGITWGTSSSDVVCDNDSSSSLSVDGRFGLGNLRGRNVGASWMVRSLVGDLVLVTLASGLKVSSAGVVVTRLCNKLNVFRFGLLVC